LIGELLPLLDNFERAVSTPKRVIRRRFAMAWR